MMGKECEFLWGVKKWNVQFGTGKIVVLDWSLNSQGKRLIW